MALVVCTYVDYSSSRPELGKDNRRRNGNVVCCDSKRVVDAYWGRRINMRWERGHVSCNVFVRELSTQNLVTYMEPNRVNKKRAQRNAELCWFRLLERWHILLKWFSQTVSITLTSTPNRKKTNILRKIVPYCKLMWNVRWIIRFVTCVKTLTIV